MTTVGNDLILDPKKLATVSLMNILAFLLGQDGEVSTNEQDKLLSDLQTEEVLSKLSAILPEGMGVDRFAKFVGEKATEIAAQVRDGVFSCEPTSPFGLETSSISEFPGCASQLLEVVIAIAQADGETSADEQSMIETCKSLFGLNVIN